MFHGFITFHLIKLSYSGITSSQSSKTMKKVNFSQIILAIFFALPAFSQNDTIDGPPAAFDTMQQDLGLFNSDEILILSLRFDITEYMRKKPRDEYLKAILTYHFNERDSVNKEISLKSRGITRYDFCNFPPISLNFNKSDSQGNDLKKREKIKMVTHCRSENAEYLFKEYLVYKLYNLLTDYSFKVRLTRINYINTSKKSNVINTYAFLIEPLNILAERTNSTPVDLPALTQKNIIPAFMDRMAIFNYMIGNTDWAVTKLHNCKVLSVNNSNIPGLGIAVPYDFDYSGLVDTHYAVPAEPLGLESVRQRRYLGRCRSEEEYKIVLKEFVEKKSDFYRTINEFPYLNEKSKKKMISYLDEFFSEAETASIIIKNLLRECDNF